MDKARDITRTRERILAAALAEFSASGLAGARTERIARRARVNKRMLFYCFGSKEALYTEVLRSKLAQRAGYFDTAPEDLPGTLLHCYEEGSKDLDWVRLLEWEALASDGGALTGESDRRDYLARFTAKLRRAQAAGRIPRELDLIQLQISIVALTVFPLAFPQMIRLASGFAPTDPRFRRRRLKFLRWLGQSLAADADPPAGTMPGSIAQPRTTSPCHPKYGHAPAARLKPRRRHGITERTSKLTVS